MKVFLLKHKKETAIVLLILIIAGLVYTLKQTTVEKNRLGANQRSLLENVSHYKTKDSLSAASIEKLTLTNGEFKKHEKDLLKTIDDLNLKVKRLQSVSQTGTETKYEIKTQINDSLIYVTGEIDTLKCIDYRDAWLTVSGCIRKGQFDGLIESRDTLVQVVHRVPHKFLFFRYGVKAIRQEIVSKNPYTNISYAKYIELKK